MNRSEQEDDRTVVSEERLEALFEGLAFDRINDQAGSGRSLIREIWRLFLLVMLIALIAEALLCLPRRKTSTESDPLGRGEAGRRDVGRGRMGRERAGAAV